MISIRKAKHSDLYSVGVVQVESNRSTYNGIMPETYLQNLSYEEKAESWERRLFGDHISEFMYVAECSENGVIGFVAASTVKTNDSYERELNAVYILKEYQGKGIGKMLINAVVSDYIGSNVRTMMLWTLEQNPARQFYEHLGGRLVDTRTIDRGGKQLIQVSYGWEDIRCIEKVQVL
ncbi:MAG: GNAT family N-acetyltransferase [Bacillota bacterium]